MQTIHLALLLFINRRNCLLIIIKSTTSAFFILCSVFVQTPLIISSEAGQMRCRRLDSRLNDQEHKRWSCELRLRRGNRIKRPCGLRERQIHWVSSTSTQNNCLSFPACSQRHKPLQLFSETHGRRGLFD